MASMIVNLDLSLAQAQTVTGQGVQPGLGAFDQYQLSYDDPSVTPAFGNDDYKLETGRSPEGQAFTVPTADVLGASTADLTAFSYFLTAYNFVGQTYQATLRSSAAGSPIIQESATITASGSGSGDWITFSFSAAPVLTAGTTYYFDLQNTGGGGWGDIGWSVNPSTGNSTSGAYSADGTWFPAASRTFIANLAPTDVPEPATMAMLGLGAAGWLAFRRRKA